MALKVAELFATLGIDASGMARDVDKAVSTSSRSLREVVGAAEKAGTDAGTAMGDGLADGLHASGQQVQDRFKEQTRDLPARGREAGQEAGQGIGGGILDGMPDLSGGIGGLMDDALSGLPASVGGPALAAGAAAGALMVQGVATALERGQIESRFEAALGVNEATAARLGDMAGDIYASNFGESVQQVGESIRLVGQNFAGVADLSESELARVNEYALNTASEFDQDLRMVINATAQLLRTGLAKDAEEAFDIITRGLQLPANKADDLLETFNEYSTMFRDVGIDGEEALGLINQMVEAGARDADIAADSIKEFSIRAKDGSETTVAAFQALGIESSAAMETVAAGGEGAQQVLADTLDRLREMDGVAREQTGVALFGTQWEDLGDAILAADLDTAVAQLGRVDGAAQGAADSFDDTGSKVETLKREVSEAAGDMAEGFLAPLAEAASDDRTWSGMAEAIAENVEQGLNLVPFGSIVNQWGETIAGSSWWKELFGGEVAPLPDDSPLRKRLADLQAARASAPPLLDLGALTVDNTQAVASLDQVNELLELSAELSDIAAQRGQFYLDRIASSSGLDDQLLSTLDLTEATWDLSRSLKDLSGNFDVSEIAAGNAEVFEDQAGVLRDVVSVGADAQAAIAGVLQWEGEAAATERAGELREQFKGMFEDAGYTTEQVNELLELMGLADWQIEAGIKLSGADEAMAQLTLIRDFLMNDDGTSGLPREIEMQVALAVSEGRAVDALNLVQTYLDDKQDGMIDNPLLIQLGLGDTTPAEGEVEGWKAGEEAKPPARIPIDADTDPARGAAWTLAQDIMKLNPTITVGVAARFANFAEDFPIFGNGVIRRAGGGPVVGPGGPTSDMVPMLASNGEFVVNAAAAQALGPDALAMVNSGQLPAIPMPTGAAAATAAAGGSSVPMAELSALAGSVDRLAREVALKGDTNYITAPNPAAVPRYLGRAKRANAWARGVG